MDRQVFAFLQDVESTIRIAKGGNVGGGFQCESWVLLRRLIASGTKKPVCPPNARQ